MANDNTVTADSPEAELIFKNHLFDYGYVNDTVQEHGAFICVETDMAKLSSETMAKWVLYIDVFCHRDFMKLDPTIFPKMVGNRRDNLVKAISDAVDGFNVIGLGTLNIQSIHTVSAPTVFTCREIKFQVPDFANHYEVSI